MYLVLIYGIVTDDVISVASVRILGAYFDESMAMSIHVNRLVSLSFYQLRLILAIRRSILASMAIQLDNSIAVSRINYCNSLLVGLPEGQLDRIQSVLDYAVRIIYGRGKYDRVTPFLRDKLRWLRVPQKVQYKLCLLMYKALKWTGSFV